ncbi:hypothetical protein AAFF_G00270910 [Aldrovandia affinis]|uniref:Uncharacterized protein n=1 Tax=Aldrovandia affinis TaxID=143900 RepID=A0AAD7W252_9TELE|nr:hypothetical protein AAFF_G00270910 [Aldrovandia affinis]
MKRSLPEHHAAEGPQSGKQQGEEAPAHSTAPTNPTLFSTVNRSFINVRRGETAAPQSHIGCESRDGPRLLLR